MKIDLFNIDDFVKINKCPEVTSPIYLDANKRPNDDGLFSYIKFGIPGSYDRKTIFGYINLKKPFLNAVVYKIITSMNKKIVDLITGNKYFIIKNGELIEDESGETGIQFLYKNWDIIKFSTTGSRKRDDKIAVLQSLKKDEVFITKQLIIPAYYRDINFSKVDYGKISKDSINNLYSKLIAAVASLDENSGFDFMGSMIEARVQLTIVEIYDELTSKLSGKTGLIQDSFLGKQVDYAIRGVISAPRIKSDTWEENRIDFSYTGLSLAACCSLFMPFFIKEIQDFLREELDTVNFVYSKDKNGNLRKIYLKNPMEDYSYDKIKKLINNFIKSSEDRFTSLQVNTEEGYKPMTLYYDELQRNFTITDLLYILAVKIVEDKHVYISRYPIETYQNIYPSKIHVLSTLKTESKELDNKWFMDYPVVYPDYPIEKNPFVETIMINNCFLEALGGDYDGKVFLISLTLAKSS